MRIALLSKTFVADTAQRQLEWLARQPGIELVLITPAVWCADDGGAMPFRATFASGYRVNHGGLEWPLSSLLLSRTAAHSR